MPLPAGFTCFIKWQETNCSGVQSDTQLELVILASETFFGGTHHLHLKVIREKVSLRFLVLKMEVSSEHRGDEGLG